jgi:hypothetical protein
LNTLVFSFIFNSYRRIHMGNGVAQHFSFTYAYQKEHLNKDLAEHFVDDPKNFQIVHNIYRLKEVLCEKPELCIVARQELANTYLPTCMQSAQLEYQRLLSLYEMHLQLRSVLARVSFVACPLGHYCDQVKGEGKNCSVCTKKYDDGYICRFCEYELCEPCSFIYCLGTSKRSFRMQLLTWIFWCVF